MSMDVHRWLAILAAAVAIPGLFACVNRQDSAGVTPPTHASSLDLASLADARLDAARASGANPHDVTLIDVQPVVWDGCLGVAQPGRACAQLAVSGLIARFDAAGQTLRYHLAGARVIGPVTNPTTSDATPSSTGTDASSLEATLAYYARADLALRERLTAHDITVTAAFPGTCGPGLPLPNVSCAVAGYRADIELESDAGPSWYRITSIGRSATVAPLESPGLADSALATLQQDMRADLARRVALPITRISILSYVRIQWPDACLGIEQPGQVCAQAVTPGFEALLLVSSDRGPEHRYTYRGTGSHFVAADFVPMATILPAP
jgi:hypothetical protein